MAITLKPDLFVVTADSHFEAHCFIEVDRATEHLPAIVRKCRTYQAHHQSGVEQTKNGLFPLVVWVAPDQPRADKIRRSIDTTPGLDPGLFTVTTRADAIRVLSPDPDPAKSVPITNPKGGTS